MGIPESKAIESYFMCGKNVEMAVQYYFEVRPVPFGTVCLVLLSPLLTF